MNPRSSSNRPFQLDDFVREARETVDRAKEQGARLLREARARAEQIEEEAARKGHEEGYARGQEAGRSEGERRAYEEALKTLTETTDGVQQRFESIVEALEERRDELETKTHEALVTLAIRIAEKILRTTLDRQPENLQDLAREAVLRLSSEEEITVRLHPDDYAHLVEYLPRVVESLNESPTLRMLPDSGLERGDVLATGQWGSVDATLRTQLREIERVLGPGTP